MNFLCATLTRGQGLATLTPIYLHSAHRHLISETRKKSRKNLARKFSQALS